MEVAVAADGEEAVSQGYRAQLNRAPDSDPPDFDAVRPQGANYSVGSAQDDLSSQDRHRGGDRPVEARDPLHLRLGAGLDPVDGADPCGQEEGIAYGGERAQDRGIHRCGPKTLQVSRADRHDQRISGSRQQYSVADYPGSHDATR